MDHNFVKFTRWCHGSPVHRYGLYALQWIVEINGKPTPDLEAFVNVTKVYPPAPSPALFQYMHVCVRVAHSCEHSCASVQCL
jgi:hypothetical protein